MHWRSSNFPVSFSCSGACLHLLLDYFISFSGKRCLLRAIKDLANFLESKTSRLKISINSVLHVALLVFSIPEKPENEHSTVSPVANYTFSLAVVILTWQWEADYYTKQVYLNCYMLSLLSFLRIKIKEKEKEISHKTSFDLCTSSKKWCCTEVCI